MTAAEWEKLAEDSLLSPRDRVALRALAGDRDFQKDAHVLTDHMNPDRESSLYLLSLGIIGYRQGFGCFPEDIIPRIQGLHRYYQVRNGAVAPWLKERLKQLEDAGIPAMLTGGTAMRAYYAADTPRMMYGYDITVPSDAYERAGDLLKDSVRHADKEDPKDRTINGLTFLHLYRGVPDSRLFEEKGLWERASGVTWLNHRVLVPSKEDMLFHLLCIPYGPWAVKEEPAVRVRRLWECFKILELDPSPAIAADLAGGKGLKEPAAFHLRMIGHLVGSRMESGDLEMCFPSDEKYEAYISAFGNLCRITDTIRHENKAGLLDRARRKAAWQKVLKLLQE